ncbi:dihydroneopterin aldolase [Alkalihalobacillus trypoxylicola]|uniref:7,8-dihydroneopterin aldolase n=1 Tax=Alkalihalobacillus trypoxylicola TaxID=519424 RepID=A0A162ENF2_9BACI|nr:dihydroneopterin aldolase [Alkalihalobacillus trypoxylicola]KYG33327.1 dihydroneopterin aldolase [Alkalihalobacillus trypoxylicola]
MDKIYMNQLSFYGYHGVFAEEQKLGQRFQVDLTLELDLKKAGRTDELDQTINYGEVYEIVKKVVEGRPYKLVEAVAENISQELLRSFNLLKSCTIKLIKPDPPIPGHYQSVAVEITRSQEDLNA